MNTKEVLKSLGVSLGTKEKLQCIAVAQNSAVLKAPDGSQVNVETELYHRLVAMGHATKLGSKTFPEIIPNVHASLTQAMQIHVIRRDAELRLAGNSAKRSVEIIREEVRDHPRFARYLPTNFALRTLQLWKQKKHDGGKTALLPRTDERGNRGPRYDELYEQIAWEVLEAVFLKNDRTTIGQIAPKIKNRYLAECLEQGLKSGTCGKRCLTAVLAKLRVDDIIKARHDTETAKKLLLQARFFHRVKAPFDLVEIDCTTADIHLSDQSLICVGRPTICAAIDAATGFPLAIRLSLQAPREALVVRALRDIMTDRGDEYFDNFGITNRIEFTGTLHVISSDQGSENSGPHLTSIVEKIGAEWAKNIPGCPEKKPFVERFFLELNRFLQNFAGSTNSRELPHRQRSEKGMLEACLTLEELEKMIIRWVYDTYVLKLRRLIHSPLRKSESPSDSWKRLSVEALCPPAPEDIRQWFMVQQEDRKLQRYGVEVGGVHYFSEELGELIRTVGTSASVDVRFDPTDIREIAVSHPTLDAPLIVPAKSEDVAAVSFADAQAMRRPDEKARKADLSARANFTDLIEEAQKMAEDRGKGKITSMKKARTKEALRQKHKEILDRSKQRPETSAPSIHKANQSYPKLPIKRQAARPAVERME